jgi:ribosomal protein S27AE
MKDEFVSIDPSRFGGYVIRLPSGNVQVNGTLVEFPAFCPRCGSSPAKTGVRLHPPHDSEVSFVLPFCARCGWSLRLTGYLYAILLGAFMFFIFPHWKVPTLSFLSKVPTEVIEVLCFLAVGWVFSQIFELFYKPRVQLVGLKGDFAEFAFEDPMYAEKFVELNR